MTYADGFRKQCIERMLGEEQITTTALARETGVSSTTLSRWRLEARSLGGMTTGPDGGSRSKRSAEEKLRLVSEAMGLDDEQLGEFLRREGVHASELDVWRRQFVTLMDGARSQVAGDQRKVRELERELARKDKALAEFAALVALQKKAKAIWGDGDDATPPKSES